LASAKFDTWWHYLRALGPSAPTLVDSVIVPFVEFCYGQANEAQRGQPQASPVKRYASLTVRSLEALAHLLGGRVDRPALAPLDDLDGPLLSAKALSAHHAIIMHAISQSFSSVNLDSANEVALFESIFSAIAAAAGHVPAATPAPSAEGGVDAGALVIGSFLATSRCLVAKGGQVLKAIRLALFVANEVLHLPGPVLCSRDAWAGLYFADGDTPAQSLLRLLVDPLMATSLGDDKLQKQLLATMRAIFKRVSGAKYAPLDHIETAMEALEEATTKMGKSASTETAASHMWRLLADALREYVVRHQDVDQARNPLDERRTTCCELVLGYPLKYLSHYQGKGLWKQYQDLAKMVLDKCALIVQTDPLDVEAKLCLVIKEDLHKNSLSKVARALWPSVLGEVSLEVANAGEAEMKDKISRRVISICASIGRITSATAKAAAEEDAVAEFAAAGEVMAEAIFALSKSAKSDVAVNLAVRHLLPPLEPLLRDEMLGKLGRQHSDKAMAAFTAAIDMLQTKLRGPATSELAQALEPFLVTCMTSAKRVLRMDVQKM